MSTVLLNRTKTRIWLRLSIEDLNAISHLNRIANNEIKVISWKGKTVKVWVGKDIGSNQGLRVAMKTHYQVCNCNHKTDRFKTYRRPNKSSSHTWISRLDIHLRDRLLNFLSNEMLSIVKNSSRSVLLYQNTHRTTILELAELISYKQLNERSQGIVLLLCKA